MWYVKTNKALFGLLRLALDFYLKLWGKLEGTGYEINQYDPCVTNKSIGSNQHTAIWHVDDLKYSHKKAFVDMKFATWLGRIYKPKLTTKRGKIHDYLGLDLNCSVGSKVIISTTKYIYKILKDTIEVIKMTVTTPVWDNLFQVRAEDLAEHLLEDLTVAFHQAVVQLLFLSQCARQDNSCSHHFWHDGLKNRIGMSGEIIKGYVNKLQATCLCYNTWMEQNKWSWRFEHFELVYWCISPDAWCLQGVNMMCIDPWKGGCDQHLQGTKDKH